MVCKRLSSATERVLPALTLTARLRSLALSIFSSFCGLSSVFPLDFLCIYTGLEAIDAPRMIESFREDRVSSSVSTLDSTSVVFDFALVDAILASKEELEGP